MDEYTTPQNDNGTQASTQNKLTNNKTDYLTQEKAPVNVVDGSKKEITNTTKRKKWIIIAIIAIIATILAITSIGIVMAYNNGLIGEDNGNCKNCGPEMADKPIIYLYPEETTDISVKLGYPELITTDYPSYNSSWNVTAYPNGNLKIGDRNYYALYYESQNKISFEKTNVGFVVESSQVTNFLEDKLAILGLNEKESEEFIVYWLPKLQSNNYVYIRFATEDEISENMPLEVNPKPDTTIRVLMIYKGLDRAEPITEQVLTKVKRAGYTAVEWGGTEIR